jgi:hypothetical protein
MNTETNCAENTAENSAGDSWVETDWFQLWLASARREIEEDHQNRPAAPPTWN